MKQGLAGTSRRLLATLLFWGERTKESALMFIPNLLKLESISVNCNKTNIIVAGKVRGLLLEMLEMYVNLP